MAKKTLFVGLSGASSSGKTTVSNLLIKLIPHSIVIHEDDYYKNDKEIPLDPVSGEQNWDCPDALKLSQLICDLLDIKNNGKSIHSYKKDDVQIDDSILEKLEIKFESKLNKIKILINDNDLQIVFIDGFLLYFPDSELIPFLDVKLFFKVDYDILKFRRQNRSGYQTQETYWVDPPGYFDFLVYPNYLKYHEYLFVEDPTDSKSETLNKKAIENFDKSDKIIETKRKLDIEVFHVKDKATSIEQMASWGLNIILDALANINEFSI